MAQDRDIITNKMEELIMEKHRILTCLDITGGQRGIRNNDLAHKRAAQIDKELTQLNKKLFQLSNPP